MSRPLLPLSPSAGIDFRFTALNGSMPVRGTMPVLTFYERACKPEPLKTRSCEKSICLWSVIPPRCTEASCGAVWRRMVGGPRACTLLRHKLHVCVYPERDERIKVGDGPVQGILSSHRS